MASPTPPAAGDFCWLDLAASDAGAARAFYAATFGWTFREEHVPGGRYVRIRTGGREAASLYELRAAQVEAGVPSHWTPYVRVADAGAACRAVEANGGRVVVRPFAVPGAARIALVQDAVGALLGLWQEPGPGP